MIYLYQKSNSNLKKAVDEYAKFLNRRNEKLNLYELFTVSLHSSEGDKYEPQEVGFDHEPTPGELEAVAKDDWSEYYRGIEDDAEERKEEIIAELMNNYITVKTR